MQLEEILKNSYVITDGGVRLDQFNRSFASVGLAPSPNVWAACMLPGEGAMGCSISHYSLVRYAKESKLPFVVVFEDDSVPADDAAEKLVESFENRSDGCLCLRLGWSWDSDPGAGADASKHSRVYGSNAYVLFGEKAYDAYLDEWTRCGVADIVIGKMSGSTMADRSLFVQHTVGKSIHLPEGWSSALATEAAFDKEAVDRYTKAREVVAKMQAEKAVHVAYVVDIQGPGAAQFGDQLYVSAKSLRGTKRPGDSIVCHILYAHVSVELMERLHSLECDGFKIATRHIEDVDLNYWQQFSKHDPASPNRPWGGIVFARMWLPRFLPDCNRCIYLDADTMVRAPISELWSKDLGGKWLGMDMGSVPEYGYNSGVMLMDLKAMRSDATLYDRLGKFMRENARGFYCPDQTVINRFFAGNIAEIGREWNYPPTPSAADPLMNTAKVWHFYNGHQKPYRIDGDDFGRALVAWNNVLSSGV